MQNRCRRLYRCRMQREPRPADPMADDARLYGASIAIVSGAYSIASPLTAGGPMSMIGAAMGISGWVMLLLGFVVLAHGIALLTPAAAAIGRASGPLMIAWAAIMLLNQSLVAVVPAWSMDPAMTVDWGMVAIALIMLTSGMIMSRPRAMA